MTPNLPENHNELRGLINTECKSHEARIDLLRDQYNTERKAHEARIDLLKDRLKVVEAYEAGERIVARSRSDGATVTLSKIYLWNWLAYDYTIAPKPRERWEIIKHVKSRNPPQRLLGNYSNEKDAKSRFNLLRNNFPSNKYELVHYREVLPE